VVEVAPASGLEPKLRQRLFDDAVKITRAAGYRAAGTVEFLVEPKTGNYFFIEVNPRVQVEHTITEVITGIDIVQSQVRANRPRPRARPRARATARPRARCGCGATRRDAARRGEAWHARTPRAHARRLSTCAHPRLCAPALAHRPPDI
jgi:biotin carboxylase